MLWVSLMLEVNGELCNVLKVFKNCSICSKDGYSSYLKFQSYITSNSLCPNFWSCFLCKNAWKIKSLKDNKLVNVDFPFKKLCWNEPMNLKLKEDILLDTIKSKIFGKVDSI